MCSPECTTPQLTTKTLSAPLLLLESGSDPTSHFVNLFVVDCPDEVSTFSLMKIPNLDFAELHVRDCLRNVPDAACHLNIEPVSDKSPDALNDASDRIAKNFAVGGIFSPYGLLPAPHLGAANSWRKICFAHQSPKT